MCVCAQYYLKEVQFLFDVCEHLHRGTDLARQLGDVLIPLLYLLREVHITDLQLLKVDHVEAFCQLLLVAQSLG